MIAVAWPLSDGTSRRQRTYGVAGDQAARTLPTCSLTYLQNTSISAPTNAEKHFKDDFYSKIPTKNFFYFLPICSLKYA